MRVALSGGAYTAAGVIADAQRCVNLYPEANPEGSPAPYTYYPTPGLTPLATSPVPAASRCNFRTSNGDLYRVVGSNVYYVDPSWNHAQIGTIAFGTTPVSMIDNGLVAVLVDGTTSGYALDLVTRAFGQITDPAFCGADRVDYVDTYFVFNWPVTQKFYISLSTVTYGMLVGGTAFDPTDVAAKVSYQDNLMTVCVLHRDIWLIGSASAEIWTNTGASDFTFQQQPGTFIEHGTAAKYSVATQDMAIYWVSQDKEGQGIILRGSAAYQVERISTHAMEQEFAKYITISDAIGFCYQQNGHTFYQISFPTAQKTWVYDEASKEWHERNWSDPDGQLLRHRANCCANAYGKIVVGDWENGNLYALDTRNYTDNGNPIARIRSFPHLMNDMKRVNYKQFVADIQCGEGDAVISLRWSDDRGRTYGNKVDQTMGKLGQYLASPQWPRLGIARDRVFELSWSNASFTALNGAFIETEACRT